MLSLWQTNKRSRRVWRLPSGELVSRWTHHRCIAVHCEKRWMNHCATNSAPNGKSIRKNSVTGRDVFYRPTTFATPECCRRSSYARRSLALGSVFTDSLKKLSLIWSCVAGLLRRVIIKSQWQEEPVTSNSIFSLTFWSPELKLSC